MFLLGSCLFRTLKNRSTALLQNNNDSQLTKLNNLRLGKFKKKQIFILVNIK